jgi:hypothetical protein
MRQPLSCAHNGGMVSALEVAHAVGPSLLRVVAEGSAAPEVRDVFLAEPTDPAVGQPGDLVLGVALDTPARAVGLLQRCATGGACGLVLPADLAGHADLTAAAERAPLPVLALQDGTTWAHLVWLLRGVVDRAQAPDLPSGGDASVHSDLFALADAAAAIVAAPVTIEDNRSRVLAYSSGQAMTDTARVSTIVGRRVPEEVVAHFRARGVFRRLARSNEPFLVPERADGTRPRLVVPVRAGGEWLGSIWAVVDGPVDERTTAELRNAASVVALHLLHLRAQADVVRRAATDRLRSALSQFSPERARGLALPPATWVVVALDSPDGYDDASWRLELWEAAARRHSWTASCLADLDGTVFAVVSEHGSRPGSWEWLRRLVDDMHGADSAIRAAAGGPAGTVADLPRSRAEAAELLGLLRDGRVPGPSVRLEQAWAALTVRRAAAALEADPVGGPLAALVAHDAEHHTDYVATLAAWLAHPGQPRRAAAELVIHPNTLRYRMRHLTTVAALDLDRPPARLALQLQIQALRAGTGDGSAVGEPETQPLPRD